MLASILLVACVALGQQDDRVRELKPEELELVSDTLKDAWTFWQVDADNPSVHTTRYVWANQESVDLLGIDRNEARGKSFADTMAGSEGEHGRRWVNMYADAIHTGMPVRLDEAAYDGTVYRVTVLPVAEDLIVVMFRDVRGAPHRNLEITDDDWLRIQYEALQALHKKTADKIEAIEDASEERDSATQELILEQGPVSEPEPTGGLDSSPLP